jgi:hypothetical protein
MSTVASVDYPNRRIYLSAATVGTTLDLLDVYRDVRALRRVTEPHRAFKPMLVAGGNIQKTATTFTQPYVQVLYGCYFVPYDAPGTVKVVREVFSDDGRAGLQCFDRVAVAANVDLDYAVQAVEVRLVTVSGSTGPTAAEIAAAVRLEIAIELARVLAAPTAAQTADAVWAKELP